MNKIKIIFSILIVLISTAWSSNSYAQSAGAVYEHSNYRGAVKYLRVGSYNVNNLSPVGNDKISSIKVNPGYKIYVYEHSAYKGASRVYSRSSASINTFNDRISSIKVVRVSTPTPSNYLIKVYRDANYQGPSQSITRVGNYNVNNIRIGNDQISSIQVKPGYAVVVYEHSDYRGASRILSSSSAYLSGFNNRISSFKVRRKGSTPNVNYNAPTGYTPCAYEGDTKSFSKTVNVAYGANGRFRYLYNKRGSIRFNNATFGGDPAPSIRKRGYYKYVTTPKPSNNYIVMLYADGNYRGQSQTISSVGSYNLNRLSIGNDRISSLRVKPGYEVVVYEHSDFRGGSRTYRHSASGLSGFNDKISSIRVRRRTTNTNVPVTAVTSRNLRYLKYEGMKPMNGGYYKKSGSTWYEYKNRVSKIHSRFSEVRRDDNNVYLKRNDGADVRLDIRNKKIYINGRLAGKIGVIDK